MSTPADYTLILLGRFAGKDRAVATALAAVFEQDDEWGVQVVGSAPITLLDGLSAEQAQGALAAVAPVEAVGSRFEVRQGADPGLPKLSWSQPPRVGGRVITELQPNVVHLILPCPYTGQKMRLSLTVNVTRAGAQAGVAVSAAAMPALAPMGAPAPAPMPMAAPAAMPVPVPAAAPRSVPVPVPVPVPAPLSPAPRSVSVPVPATARPMPAPAAARPLARSPVPVPQALPPRQATPAGGQPLPVPDEPFIEGLDSLDELQPLEPAAATPMPAPVPVPIPVPAPAAIPAPAPRAIAPMRAAGGGPARANGAPTRPPLRRAPQAPPPLSDPGVLPDVPVLPAMPPPMQPQQFDASGDGGVPMPDSPMGVPMDLSAFEAGVTASGIMQAAEPLEELTPEEEPAEVPADEPAEAPAEEPQPEPPPVPAAPADDGSLFNVSIGKTNNARIHQVVAEIQGISVEDAAKLCQKPFVTVGRDVNSAQAREIKQQLAAVNCVAKVMKRKVQ
ncbi:MAG TPA: hypothetical protein VGP72_25510 [Planctomycetota bacterium]